VPHRARPWHDRACPVHVTLRARPGVPGLRGPRLFPAVREALASASRFGLRVCHFSVQHNHVHLLVEAPDTRALCQGMRGLAIRVALAINRARGHAGRVWADRWHGRALTSPKEVRHALVYLLNNWHKHDRRPMGLDPCSSALWLDGWRGRWVPPPGTPPVATPRTWLLRAGWRRHELLTADEVPRSG
jgi:putative transposase